MFFPAPTRPLRAATLTTLLLALAVLPNASAATRELLTVPVTGERPSSRADLPTQQAVSADGERVVFSTSASNLDTVDRNAVPDVFVRDRAAGETIRVSATPAGGEPNGASTLPALSADGRWVAFLTKATNLGLASGDAGFFDLVERDLSKQPGEAGAFRVVQLDVAATATQQPSIAANGDRVAFTTTSPLTGADDDFTFDVYVRTLSAGAIVLASVGANVSATGASISADGSAVGFITPAAISAADANTVADAYVRDLATATTIYASPGQTKDHKLGDRLSLSADGDRIAFSTNAPLVAADVNGKSDVYLNDLATHANTRLSVGGVDREAHGTADAPTLSADASRASFASTAADLVPERGVGFVRLRDLAKTIAPAEVDGAPTISGDGGTVVYERWTGGTASSNQLWADDTEPDGGDTTAPALVVPGDLTFPATNTRGRHVRFAERATDAGGSGLVGTSCNPPSGAGFAVGTTTVTCVAADAAGNETVKTFTITILDKAAPRLSVPDSVTLLAPAGGTAPLDVLVKAVDDVDGAAPQPTCTPASGTLLPIGTTTVNCSVTDAAGNSAAASYPVKVVSAQTVPAAAAATVVTTERARSVAVQLTVPVAPAADTQVSVTIEEGTATGQDFDGQSRTLVIPAGKRAASVSIPITDDRRPEDDEAFTVRFAGAGARPEATATVTIRDDDGPHEDRRRKDVGPMVWVDDSGHRLMALQGNATEPEVIATERTAIIIDPDVSPDGREVLYLAGGLLKRRPIAGGKAEVIDGVSDVHANHPLWRPDGEAIVYFSHEGPSTWATVISLVDDREPITYGVPNMTGDTFSWNPGGTALAIVESEEDRGDPVVWDETDLAIMDPDTGQVTRRWRTLDQESMPQYSPDGSKIAFLRQRRIEGGRANRWTGATVSVLDIATGRTTDLTPPADVASGSTYGPPTWSADSKAIAYVDRDMRRGTGLPFRIATVNAAGGPIGTRYDFADPDVQDLVPDQGELEWAGLAADGPSEEGRIIFARRNAAGTSSRLLSVAPTGEDERVVADLGTSNAAPAIAADGTWLAYSSTRARAEGEIYVSTPGGRAVTRITDNLVPDGQPALSDDGRYVAFVRGTGAGREIWVHDREAGEEERLVAAGSTGVGEPTFEPGSDAVAFVKYGAVPEIRQIGLDGGADHRITDGTAPAFDRSGERIAFQRTVGDDTQVYVADAAGLNAEKLTDQPGGATHPSWGPDDRSLAYGTHFGIAMTTVEGGQPLVATQEETDGEPTWARPAPAPALRAEDVSVTEGTGGTTPAGVVLTIDRPIDDPVTVRFATADDTAKAPRDYTARGPETITISAGETTTTVPVEIQADAMDEPDEQLSASLTNAANAAITRATATVSVRDDDDPPSLTVTGVTMPEGDLGDTDATFVLRLSAESGWTVGVHAQTAHGTTDDDDLTPTSVDVSFAPGVLEQSVRVPVHGDTQNEPDEEFSLVLSSQSHVTGPGALAIGTLQNDDAVGKLPDTGITAGPGALIRTPTPSFAFIGSVPRGRFECRTDQLAWVACTSPQRVRAVADGAHTFAVRAFDGDLVDPSPATYAYTVDTVAPATTIVGGPPRVSAQRRPMFRMASDDATAHLECRLDRGDWFACGPTWQPAASLADGDHAFAARAVDPAGNADPTPAALAFRIDSRAPETYWIDRDQPLDATAPTSSAASVGLSAGSQPKLSLTGDGVASVPVTCSPAATAPCTGQVTVEQVPAAGSLKAIGAAVRAATPTGAVLGRTTYEVAPGATSEIALRLSDAARYLVERKGTVSARVLVTQSGGGSAAPVAVSLTADPAAPRALDAGARVRVNAAARTVTVRVRCPRPVLPPKGSSKTAAKAARARAKAACHGTAELRVDGASGAATARLRGAPGQLVRLRLRLPSSAAARVARSATTPASLRLTWNAKPVQAKTVDLTLTRGASR